MLPKRQHQGYPAAGDGGAAGAAIGIQHVAIQRDLAFPQELEVHGLAQAAADEALDLHGASLLLALGGLPIRPGVGGPRQHAVLRREPALALALHPAGDSFLQADGTEDMGIAGLDEAGTIGVQLHAGLEG